MLTPNNTPPTHAPEIDDSLIEYFLTLSPEERLESNDNAVNTIIELRKSFSSQQSPKQETNE